MTKDELEKATGQELIDARDYCGVDNYYAEYLKDVNAEMLKRFEHITELKEKVSFLEDNLRVARKDRENLQLNVAKGLKEFVKDYPATSLRYLANKQYVEENEKLKKRCANYEATLSKMEKGICDICKETEKDKKIEELEKENEELRKKYLQATDDGTSWAHLKSLEKENEELRKRIDKVDLDDIILIKIINCIKFHLCKQDEDYDKPIISPKFLSDILDQMAIDGFEWN